MSVAATLAAADAPTTCWDALVIGAGPAGALSARQLARLGLRTLLVDRKAFPRAKVCGACVNERALAVLRQVGLGPLVESLGPLPLRSFHLHHGGCRVTLPLPGGAALSREALDAALVGAAVEAGTHFLPETFATVAGNDVDLGVRAVRLVGVGGAWGIARTRVVLAADGLAHNSLAETGEFQTCVRRDSRIGVGTTFERFPSEYGPGMIRMAVARGGYVGLVRLEDGRLNVAAALDPGFVRACGGPADAVTNVLSEAGLPPIPSLPAGAWLGTLPLTRRPLRPVGQRVFVLGDAAGYVEPFTGEGIAWALTAAAAIPPLVQRGIEGWSLELEREWVALHGRLVRRRQAWCYALAWLMRHHGLIGPALRLFATFPALARPIVRRLNAPDPCRDDPLRYDPLLRAS